MTVDQNDSLEFRISKQNRLATIASEIARFTRKYGESDQAELPATDGSVFGYRIDNPVQAAPLAEKLGILYEGAEYSNSRFSYTEQIGLAGDMEQTRSIVSYDLGIKGSTFRVIYSINTTKGAVEAGAKIISYSTDAPEIIAEWILTDDEIQNLEDIGKNVGRVS